MTTAAVRQQQEYDALVNDRAIKTTGEPIVTGPSVSERGGPVDGVGAVHRADEAEAPPPVPHLRGFSDLEILAQPDPEFVVEGLLPQAGLVELVGRWGAGKTFVLLDLAMHIAAGLDWQGRRTRRGPVLYVYAEGAMRMRVAAWRAAHQVEPETTVGVTFIPGTVNLLDPVAVESFAQDIMRGQYGAVPVLIVFETLTRMTPGGAENTPETGSMVVANCGMLQRLTGATIAVSHHTPWDVDKQRHRGHSNLPDASDAIYLIENKNGALTLTCQKMRDAEEPDPIHLKLTPQGAGLVIDAGATLATRCDDMKKRIIQVATSIPGLSTNDLIGSVGGNRSKKLTCVNQLAGSGELVNTGTDERPKWRHNPPSVPMVPNGSGTVVPPSVPAPPSLGGAEPRTAAASEQCVPDGAGAGDDDAPGTEGIPFQQGEDPITAERAAQREGA